LLEIIPEYAATPISQALLARFSRVHRYRSIGVLSGPPGVGKTTAATRFIANHPGEAILITMPAAGKKGLNPLAASKIVLDAIWEANGQPWLRPADPGGRYIRLAGSFNHAVRAVSGLDMMTRDVPLGGSRLTLVIDEAQNLSRDAIELLRYLNDEGSGYAPFQVGLTFMGNNEFALRSGANGQSVISAAVADRALFVEGLSYQDLTAEDLRLIVEARLEIEDDALELAIKAIMARPDRSFRAAIRFCLEVREEAVATGATTITRPHVAAVLGLA